MTGANVISLLPIIFLIYQRSSASGTQQAEYIKIYNEEIVKNHDRKKARNRIGSVFADKESPSTTSSGESYRDYYAKPYTDHYDNDGENP